MASSLATAALAVRTNSVQKKYKFYGSPVARPDLPTVSVCIAARNETHALAQCLERILKSDYQKLEVLVLDDSSNDDTSLIIKSYASGGVRFIAGTTLPDGWLGKNHAYQQLIDEASGDIVLFLDVDTTLKHDTISRLVDAMLSPKLAMLSVLPRRDDIEHPSSLFNTLRYHWELLLGTNSNPPAASALWMVKKESLNDQGVGLRNYGMSIRPERHMARQLHAVGAYKYFVSSKTLGVGFEKRLASQWETATRLYYPMLGRNMFAWLTFMIFLLLLLAPIGLLLSFQWHMTELNWVFFLAIANVVLLTIISSRLHSGSIMRLRVLVWPFLIVQELMLMTVSLIAHASGSVTWKGRSINAQPDVHDHLVIDE